MTADSTDFQASPNRYCHACGQHKSIRGVWYLVQAVSEESTRFYCESCFSSAGARPGNPEHRERTPLVDPSRIPLGPGAGASEFGASRHF